jgi:hypothetical protein
VQSSDWAFIAMAINPIGGLLVALPFAILELGYRPWVALVIGTPLAYVQVIAVDLSWSALARIPWWNRWLERRKSPRIQRLIDSRGGFWITMVTAPLLGPGLVMAFMRYAHIPHRRVAVPIFLGIASGAIVLTGICVFVPRLFAR